MVNNFYIYLNNVRLLEYLNNVRLTYSRKRKNIWLVRHGLP